MHSPDNTSSVEISGAAIVAPIDRKTPSFLLSDPAAHKIPAGQVAEIPAETLLLVSAETSPTHTAIFDGAGKLAGPLYYKEAQYIASAKWERISRSMPRAYGASIAVILLAMIFLFVGLFFYDAGSKAPYLLGIFSCLLGAGVFAMAISQIPFGWEKAKSGRNTNWADKTGRVSLAE